MVILKRMRRVLFRRNVSKRVRTDKLLNVIDHMERHTERLLKGVGRMSKRYQKNQTHETHTQLLTLEKQQKKTLLSCD